MSDRLARPHQVELGFLEIRGDPFVFGHEDHQHLPRLGQRADRSGDSGRAAGHGCGKVGALQVIAGMLQGGFHLLKLGSRAEPLGLQHRDLLLGGDGIGLGARHAGFGLGQNSNGSAAPSARCRRRVSPGPGRERSPAGQRSAPPGSEPPVFVPDRCGPSERRSGRPDWIWPPSTARPRPRPSSTASW